ncbi:MAG: type VI secretion system membrane subunit TssM [Hyalangium sp.]|uniref:type VI secretion system membrane subunit TssM n=1 Tax=Hyalangium sp. TaxID=2028555 RepID=UPI0038998A7D
MLLYAIAVLVLGLVWGGNHYSQVSDKAALIATGVTVFFVLLVTLVRRLLARAKKKREQASEKPPTPSTPEPAKAARTEFSPELQAMQTEFARAAAALKTSKLSRGGRDALSVLPWYLVIGPPESGKSTALRNSGLKFPYLSNRGGGGGRSVGQTRHCDWWLTNEAVFLDAAGRYVSGEEDREEWISFLDTLGRHRPQRPLNGLIVAVSVNELMGTDPQAAGELGQRIRERIDELTSRLRIVVPIYVMITKCDLLTGFVEMFSDLPRSERGQIWGFTVPMATQPEAPTELLLKRFDEMTGILEQRSVRRLGQERRLETRERIYQFPQRFDSIRKNLSEFIQPLFLENVFQDTPVMRGVYFSSGTQEVRPLEQRQQTTPGDALLSPARPSAEAVTEGRSFFIWDVFNKVMFQDQKLAVRSSMEEIRQRKRRYTMAGACLAIALALLVLPTLSFFENREMLQKVREAIVSVQPTNKEDITRFRELGALQHQLDELTQYQDGSAPLWLRMGLYKGAVLFPLAQSFYNSQLKALLLGHQYDRIKQSLELFSQNQDQLEWKPSNESYGKHFDDLKMYLLITYPPASRVPELDKEQQKWLVKQIIKHWEDIGGRDSKANVEQTISDHAKTYIAMLARDREHMAFPLNEQLTRDARRALNRVPLATLEMDRIVDQASRRFANVSLGDSVGAVPLMHATKQVRGAFTRVAWEDSVRKQMDDAFGNSEAWVLNRDAEENQETNRAALRTAYYQQYIQEWTDFLYSVSVEEPKDMNQTELLLDSLTRGKPPPIGRLFRTLAYNVHLEPPKNAVGNAITNFVDRALGQKPPEPASQSHALIDRPSSVGDPELAPLDVERHFKSLLSFSTTLLKSDDGQETFTQLDMYHEHLQRVKQMLLAMRDKPGEESSFLEKIAVERNNVELIIKSQEGDHTIFEQILLPPLKEVKGVVSRKVLQEKSQKWCTDIYHQFKSLMAQRYPFNKDSLQDAPLPELTQFLHPSTGAVKMFVQAQLAGEILPDGRRWEFAVKPSSGSGLYKGELLTYLERVNALATTLFPGDTADPLVRFTVRIRPGGFADASPSDIASITLTVDGSEELYRNGPDDRWRSMSWPGPAGALGAHLRVVSTAGNTADLDAPGEWGFFRLLERAKKIEPSPDGRSFTAIWEIPDLNNAQVSIDIRPERLANPFFGSAANPSSKLFQIFRDPRLIPPAGIAQEDRDCPPPITTAKSSP